MYLCVRSIDCASFRDLSIGFWNSSDSVVFCFFIFFKYIYSVGYDMTIFAMATMIILLCLLIVVSTGSDSIVALQTRLGNMKGISSTFTFNNVTRQFTVFKNIPFAQAPIGDLRFRKPVPFGSWNCTLDATQFGPSCVQSLEYITEYLPNKHMSEDCLVLSVYVPSDESNSKKLFYGSMVEGTWEDRRWLTMDLISLVSVTLLL